MKSKILKFLKIVVPVLLGILLVWYFYQKFTPEQLSEMKRHFREANYAFLLLSVLLSLASHILRTHRWHLLLKPLGHQPKWYNSFFAVCVAYFMNLFIPKSGEVSRAVTLNQYENTPMEHGLGTIITERLIDLIFLALFFSLAIAMNYSLLIGYISSVIPISKLLLTLLIFSGIILLFFLWVKGSKHSIALRLREFIKGLIQGMLSIKKVSSPAVFIIESLLIWGLYVASFYAATFALVETTGIGWEVIIITFVVGSFTFAFTNSGIGYYPLAVAGVMGLFGIAQPLGNAFGWLIWTANISSIIFFGFIALIGLPLVNKK
ncbi:flippase-like domain-containing protein [Flavobacteriaceae bacterium]|nr:flippase-like domain-containing protein [Flavobacteriaceae bacterium]